MFLSIIDSQENPVDPKIAMEESCSCEVQEGNTENCQ